MPALEQQQPNDPAPTVDEDFSAAFAQFANPDAPPPAAEPPAAEPPAADAPPPAAEPPAAEPPAAEPPAAPEPAAEPPAGEPPAAEPPEPVVPPAAAKPTADDILDRLDQIVSKTPPAPEPPKAAPPAEEVIPLYNEEEQQFLQGYEKDWGDVTRGEALRRRAENAALVQFIFQEVGKVLNPLRETTDALATRTHYTDIEQKIGSYDDSLRDQVETWIGTQPDYLQTAYNDVINRGTSEQVVDLVARFRKETGATPPPAAAAGGNELSDPAKKAAASLAPVETKRSGIEHKDDPNDFDAAFGRFAEALKPK